MATSAYLITTPLQCDACRHVFEKNLRDVARLNLIHYPKCMKRLDLESGPNAYNISLALKTNGSWPNAPLIGPARPSAAIKNRCAN